MEKISRIILGVLAALILVGGLIVIFIGTKSHVMYPDNYMVLKVSLKPTNTLTLQGGIVDSYTRFAGYDFKIKGDKLYIQLRHRLLFGYGDFNIKMKTDQLKKIKQVYMVGPNFSDKTLIYPTLAP